MTDREKLYALLHKNSQGASSEVAAHLAEFWAKNPFDGFLYLENHPAFARYKNALLVLESAGIVRSYLDSSGVMRAHLDVKVVRNLKWEEK